ALPERRPAAAQHAHSVERGSAITAIQFRRIVQSLEAGHGEHAIANAERIPERWVRKIRVLELERRERQLSAIGPALSGFVENMRHLHRDLDAAIFEQAREECA